MSSADAISCDGHDEDWAEESSRVPVMAPELPLGLALDLMRMSVILTDANGLMRYANRDARGLLSAQRFLRLSRGRLCAVNAKCAGALAQAIRASTEGDVSAAAPTGAAVPLLDAEQRAIAAWVLPMRQCPDRWDARLAAVYIRSSVDVLSEEMFASTYGASMAEIRVLKLLMKGLNIDEVTVALSLSRNTVRTHVKALFAKTGTTRQAELLRLAASCIAPASTVEVCGRAAAEPNGPAARVAGRGRGPCPGARRLRQAVEV
ncbi:helix-turn-helix transcriptional regulator [Rhodomicrobium sp. R_RK_3]|nr:helix-turn-helix transcriptional regulator [Rhodomicrobium sp. R_RK_3]